MGNIQYHLPAECQYSIQSVVRVEGLEGICQWCDIALGCSGGAGLAQQITVGVIVRWAFVNTLSVIEEGTHTLHAVGGRTAACSTSRGTVVAGDLITHQISPSRAGSNTRTVIIEVEGGAAHLNAQVVAEEVARVAAETESGICAVVAAIYT